MIIDFTFSIHTVMLKLFIAFILYLLSLIAGVACRLWKGLKSFTQSRFKVHREVKVIPPMPQKVKVKPIPGRTHILRLIGTFGNWNMYQYDKQGTILLVDTTLISDHPR